MLDPRPRSRCTTGMATLHITTCENGALAAPTDTPVFHAVEQKLHAGWLFDPRLPVPGPGPAARRAAPRRRHAKASRPAQTGS
ncbi:MAG: hypothetical protein JWL68_1125 [Actinomycetia bacterium]|jgi:hypothetical protein|nr:hypothetical protein [Actinomycetes bacterium]